MSSCIFCSLPESARILESESFFVIPDKFPVTPGHALIIPKRHCRDYFELNAKEQQELFDVLVKTKNLLEQQDPLVNSFNIGINCGADAGQTVFHCHVHLIPRRKKDTQQPEGGVRGVIPAKQKYHDQ